MSEDNNNKDINEINQGSQIIHVKNIDLAACLLAVGVLLRKDPPYIHREWADGKEEVIFNFEAQTSDGMWATADLVKYFKEDMKFIQENPEHPFAFAMCAIKNGYSFRDHFKTHKPYVGFKLSGGQIMYVIKDSKKYKNCVRKGLTQI